MSDIPVIETARLRLRPFAAADLEDYAAMSADPQVMRHIGGGGPVGRDVAWRQMALFNGSWSLSGVGMWALARREDDRLLGRAGFLHPEGWPGCELGWLLAREAWGQGLAFEAAAAARDHGRAALGVTALISLIRPDNTRSIALARRLGAVADGEMDFLGGRTEVWRHP